MHEFSLAQGLHAQLLHLAEQHYAERVTVVRVAVGSLSGIVIDSFEFGFEVLAKEHPVTEHASLAIEVVDPLYRCAGCGTTCQQQLPPSPCPKCGATHMVREGGDDLILTQVEME